MKVYRLVHDLSLNRHPEFSDSRVETLGPLVLDERIKALLDSARS